MVPLSKQQKKVFDYIASRQFPPSYREIMRDCGYKSLSQVHRVIEQIERRGWIKRNLGFHRSIEVVRDSKWRQMWEKSYWPEES